MNDSPELQTGVTRDIYGMPAFITLAVPDVRSAAAWFTEALDFIELFAMPPGDDPALVHLRRWRYQDILIRRSGPGELRADSHVGDGIRLSFAAEYDDLEALGARAREHGSGVVGPQDTAWNTRDLEIVSPQGLLLVFTARRPEQFRDAAFTADLDRWNEEQRRDG